MKYTYLLLHLFTVAYPLAQSFESKIRYASKWRYLFPAITIAATVFILWDILFTKWGVWGFNKEYIMGIYIYNLPVEEYMFFFTVPFSCVFIYEIIHYFDKKDLLKKYGRYISVILITTLLCVALFNMEKKYTSVTFLLCSTLIGLNEFVFKVSYMPRFYVAYLFCLIPFFIVNGILTYLPVVVYNETENLGIRMVSIPLEDTFYGMSLVLLTVMLYEYFKKQGR